MRNMRSNVALRLLPLIAVMGLGVAAGATHAATTLNQIKITSGSDLYTCILNGFSVSSGGVVSATVASCNPALGGSGGGENPDPGGGENPDPGGGENPDPGGGENPGGSVGGADPGSGTWSPDLNGSPLIVVVDQSGGAGATMTVIPGC
ncbi:hypothetical protein, partial [Thauera butanivorans]|uniref:hypothetical protein n=1 Tax=Thauera butanivorans TaxID=86174 RepID=UPI000AB623BD